MAIEELNELANWITALPIPTRGATRQLMRVNDLIAGLEQQASAKEAPAVADGLPVVAYFIDWPDEPELGHYFSEEKAGTGRSRELVTLESALAYGQECTRKAGAGQAVEARIEALEDAAMYCEKHGSALAKHIAQDIRNMQPVPLDRAESEAKAATKAYNGFLGQFSIKQRYAIANMQAHSWDIVSVTLKQGFRTTTIDAGTAAQAAVAQEPIAWLAYWGIGEKRPAFPAFATRAEAEREAARIKSNIEVRPLYAAAPTPSTEQTTIDLIDKMAAHEVLVCRVEDRSFPDQPYFAYQPNTAGMDGHGRGPTAAKAVENALVAIAAAKEA